MVLPISSVKSGKMEAVHSSNIELVIKTVSDDGIVIQGTKEMDEKDEELETTEYFLDVEEQTAEDEQEDGEFVPVDDNCDESHEEQYVTMEVEGTDEMIIQDKDVILWNKLCRICATASDKLIPIFAGEGLEHNLSNKIHSYLPLKISESDSLPIHVCYNCAATLLAWHEMSKGCLDAQQRLINLLYKLNLKNQYFNNSEVEEENIEAFLEVGTTNNEESQVQSKTENNVEAIHVVNVSDLESSNGLLRKEKEAGNGFREYRRCYRPSMPSKGSRSKAPPSPSVRPTKRGRRVVRSARRKKPDTEIHCQILNLDPKSSECSSTSSTEDGKLRSHEESEAPEEGDESGSATGLDGGGSTAKSKRSRRGRNGSGLECNECNKKFRLYNSYQIHMRIHTGEKPYTCHICGKQFGQTGSLYYHLKHVHGGVKNHACDICGRCFAMKTAMEDHRRIHTGERPYVCDSCGKTFKTKASLYIHSKIHTDEYPFKCTYCKKLFRWKQQMMNHLTTHTGEKNHMCDICGKGFGVKNELTRHRRTHSLDKPFTCQKCGVSFGQKRYLTNHNRTRHKTKASPPQQPLN